MATDPLSFLDEVPAQSSKRVSNDPLSFLDESPKRLSKRHQLATQYGLGAAETALFPYEMAVAPLASKKAMQVPYRENLMADIERLQEQKQAGLWSSQDQQLYDSLVDQLKNPQKAEQFIKPVDIGVGGLAEKGAEALGYDIKPEGFAEHGARIVGNLLSPKGLAKGIEKGASLLTKEGRVVSQWKSLSKSSKGNPEKEGWLNFAKTNELTPQEATLLIQSKGKADVLGKMAKKTKNFKETVKGLKDKLGNNYESLKTIGSKGGMISEKVSEGLTSDLSKLLGNMSKTFIEGPDTKAARKLIEESLFAIENQGGTIEHLINSRQNLRQAVDWKKVDSKGAMLKQAEEAFTKAIEHANPKLAAELKYTDKAWAKYKNFEKVLDKKLAKITYKGVEVPGFIKFLAYGGSAIAHPGPVIGGYVGKEIGQRLITKMLTNPRLQGLHKKLIHAVQEGATNKQKEVMIAVKRILKSEDPELYSEISDLSF